MSKATSGADLSSIDPACRYAHAGYLPYRRRAISCFLPSMPDRDPCQRTLPIAATTSGTSLPATAACALCVPKTLSELMT